METEPLLNGMHLTTQETTPLDRSAPSISAVVSIHASSYGVAPSDGHNCGTWPSSGTSFDSAGRSTVGWPATAVILQPRDLIDTFRSTSNTPIFGRSPTPHSHMETFSLLVRDARTNGSIATISASHTGGVVLFFQSLPWARLVVGNVHSLM